MSVGVIGGNVFAISVVSVALTPAAVNTITAPEQIFAVPGAKVGDFVFVNKPTAQAGVGIAGARVSSAGNVGITFVNPTAGNITPTAAETYTFLFVRADSTQAGVVA